MRAAYTSAMVTDQPDGTARAPLPPRPWGWTLLAMAGAALDLSFHLFQNWIAIDDGAMGLAGTLVRQGAWPHRDFADTYSGGLALLDAGAQLLFGDDLRALRIPFAVAAVLWVGLLAACFRRFCSAPAAAGLALVGFLIGPPLYTAAMPSWYLLFLATAVVWSLFRWRETGRPAWWAGAGALIGLALGIKINALFILAAAGCILLTDDELRSGPLGLLLMGLGVLGACTTVLIGWPAANAALLLSPLVALAGATSWHLWRSGGISGRIGSTFVPGGWLALGVGAIVVPWVLAYAIHGGGSELMNGVLVLPFRRTSLARLLPPTPWLLDLGVAVVFATLIFGRWTGRKGMWAGVVIIGAALWLSEAARLDPSWLVKLVWHEFRILAALALLLVAVARLRTSGRPSRPVLIAGWVAAWFALLQYPFAAPNYLAYVAPLILLAGTAAAAPTIARPVGCAIAAALALWTLRVDHGQPLTSLGYGRAPATEARSRLDLPRGGLTIASSEAREFESVVGLLDQWQARTIVAGPDAPEVYYLSGRRMRDREFFEFMAPSWSAAALAGRIAHDRPDAAVLNLRAYFSQVPIDSVVALLPTPPVADTIIGTFRILRFARAAP
jgi:hypothetical protein